MSKRNCIMYCLIGLTSLLILGCGEPQKQPDETTTVDGGQRNRETSTQDNTNPLDQVPIGCQEGTNACRCTPTGQCAKELRCEDSICRPCSAGSAGCSCGKGNTCDAGLNCSEGRCKGCVGKANCPCFGNNSCEPGNRCIASNNSIGQCKACKDNKAECNCKSDKDCGGALACINKRCQNPKQLIDIPQNPKCYTPCQGDERTSDGNIRICHPKHKLMAGCRIGQRCHEGSCVDPSQAQQLASNQYPYCLEAIDCPSWQDCIRGRCYSTCESVADCKGGLVCHRYVCRRKCSIKGQECNQQETCETEGRDDGVCVPRSNRKGPALPQKKIEGTYQLLNPSLQLSNHSTSSELYLVNKSGFPTEFSISRISDSIKSSKPLFWVKFDLCKTYSKDGKSCLAFANKPSAAQPFKIPSVKDAQMVILRLSNAGGKPKQVSTYYGSLKITNRQMGDQEFSLHYRESGDGQWKGRIISFANFNDKHIYDSQGKSKLLHNSVRAQDLPNALLRQWIDFKKGMPLVQFRAIVRSIQEGSWQLPQVRKDCKEKMSTQNSPDIVCYPYSTKLGYKVLTYSNREAPVPSGISELNFVINVKEKSGNRLEGRIATNETLQYPGNPKIAIQFSAKPGVDPITQITAMSSTIQIGGRYYTDDQKGCLLGDFAKHSVPWLVPGFTFGSSDTKQLFRERFECRSIQHPRKPPAGASDKVKKEIQAHNASLSLSNPIPNGWSINRKLELVDGVLVQNRHMILLIREHFQSFFSNGQGSKDNTLTKDFSNYALILLERTPADLEPKDFQASAPPHVKRCQTSRECGSSGVCVGGTCKLKSQLAQVTCTPDVLQQALGKRILFQDLLQAQHHLDPLVFTLIDGQPKRVSQDKSLLVQANTQGDYVYTHANTKKYIHYYCEDTKQFNAGRDNATECPTGSKITFFELPNKNNASLQYDPCQANKDCSALFASFKRIPGYRENIPYQCTDSGKVVCNEDRINLRKNKAFYRLPPTPGTHISPFKALQNDMIEAFRYRLKFTSRTGKNIGFSPSICQGKTQLVPYCYSPAVIEQIEQRVNCLQAIYTHPTLNQKLGADTRAALRRFLEFHFSYNPQKTIDGALLADFGFEMLNAELKIMLGDEAYIQAFASRYDLAGSRLASFDGTKFEPNGVTLSGALGYEMHSLYLSAQYYQMVLDRFFSQTSVIFQSFQSKAGQFITSKSVSSYFQKLLLASTRKARSWSQIAKRYHTLNRADLARHVVERAYASTYMEMMILTRLLRELATAIDAKQLAELRLQISNITRTYKSALLDMEEVYKKLSLEINFLGIQKGYIPFPALDLFSASTLATNAFTVALQFAKEKMHIAANKEQSALNNKRVFDTDAASFQSELVRIRQNYESQLQEICGGIKSGDKIYPAIPAYAYLTPETLQMGNPCGRVAGGQLYEAFIALEKARVGLKSLRIAQNNVFRQIDIEKERIQKYCAKKFELADVVLSTRDKQLTLELEMREVQLQMDRILRLGQDAITLAELRKCSVIVGTASGGNCPTAWGAMIGVVVAAIVREGAMEFFTKQLKEKQRLLKNIEKELEQRHLRVECDQKGTNPDGTPIKEGIARIESQAKLKELTNQTLNFHLEALKAEFDIRLALSQIVRLQQRAQRLITEQQENQQLAINVQAARNDPNIRIYKNDAIINAERTFEDALREAYRATLIYEYYTGQTYKHKGDLFLIRMISHGDKNLEAYVSQMEQSFREFEELNGKPDFRVMILSLKNDILNIPRLKGNKNNEPRSINERNEEFQKMLTDPDRLNHEGFYTFSFPISVARATSSVSPITINHKVLYVSAEIIGGDNGDEVGRLYLRQKGTSVVRLANNEQTFYSLPPRTAVLNPFFNGSKVLEPKLYQNYRLRDRPLGNTHWELLINQASEKANQDIDLSKVNDIKIYIHYTDFTEE